MASRLCVVMIVYFHCIHFNSVINKETIYFYCLKYKELQNVSNLMFIQMKGQRRRI